MQSLPLSMKIENLTISVTRSRKGRLLQSSTDTCHHSAQKRKGSLQSKGREAQAEIIPDAPLTLVWDTKTGMAEIENDVGRMRHHLWQTQITCSPWMVFVPTPLFSICGWPFVICILLCWATSEISHFLRQMMSSESTVNRTFADHLFL